jgi:hypothetical protein
MEVFRYGMVRRPRMGTLRRLQFRGAQARPHPLLERYSFAGNWMALVIVTAYIDESGTHDSPVTILGGWVGRLGQWASFDPQWKKLLKRNELTYFHSRKLRHSKGEFSGWSVSKKQNFLSLAAKTGLRHLEFGFAVLLGEDDYQEHYIAGYRPKEIPLDSRYGLCFRHLLSFIPRFAIEAFKGRDLDMHFVLESGHVNYGDADRIFNKVKKSRVKHEQDVVRILRTITAGDKKDFPGLQIADVAAYSAFQHSTRQPLETVALLPDDPAGFVAAAKQRQRVPVFHLRLRETELKGFKQFILDEIEEKKARSKKPNSPPSASAEGQTA